MQPQVTWLPTSPSPDASRNAAGTEDAASRATLARVLESVGARSQTLVDGSTTLLCLTSVMSTQLGDVNDRASGVASRAADIARRSRESADATTAIRALVDSAHEAVRLLGAHTKDIERISATLQRLAMETRMVGLNAAIEAARAGAAGAGFAVVADKVRELADGANQASEQIIARLSTIRDSAVTSARVMEQVGGRVHEIDAHASEIAAAAADQEGGVAEIAGGVGALATSVDDIVRAIEDMTEAGMTLTGDAADGASALAALAHPAG